MKNKTAKLTNSELDLMQILWEAKRPLCKSEIMAASEANPEAPLFAKNSFHVIINELLSMGFIVPGINGGVGRKNARTFSPCITRNEYLAMHISSVDNFSPFDIPEIVNYLVKSAPVHEQADVLAELEETIRVLKS